MLADQARLYLLQKKKEKLCPFQMLIIVKVLSFIKTTKKQPAALSLKTISTMMTGYTPVNKDFVQKSTQKYITVTVLIEFNQEVTRLWNDGVWTAPFRGLPIR
ncbi:hypothetical protein RhiirA4_458971 [Rhizophagus irregularis]|uniref:Uncharacterized protein n=1 Tax=Rhizophagus irregularis TaxID=588596 RepID=A0A2I1GDC2_9GLOM|nr:hypothetical protein RhiirA4_458971 [Rhizophagus irregularis]